MSGIMVVPGSALVAPVFIPDNEQAPAWCSKPASDFSPEEVKALGEFCRQQGWEAGWDYALAGIAHPDGRSPFHPEFLGGAAHELWRLSYRRGQREARSSEEFSHVLRTCACS